MPTRSTEPRTIVVRGRYLHEFTMHVPTGMPTDEVVSLAWEYLSDHDDGTFGDLDLDPNDIEVLD